MLVNKKTYIWIEIENFSKFGVNRKIVLNFNITIVTTVTCYEYMNVTVKSLNPSHTE